MDINTWKENGKYFDYKGNSIFYSTLKNENDTLLCLHGFPTSSYDYHKIWNKLAEKFSLVAFDMIGYGFSSKPTKFDYTTFRQADILQALMDHLQIEELHVLSHDYGNTIIQELLARDAEGRLNFTIKTICMMNGALFPETHRPILAQKILISPVGFLFNKLISEKRIRRSLTSVFGEKTQPTEKELDDFLSIFRYNSGDRIAHKLIQYMRERERYRERWVGALERLKQPFRMINGLEDRVSGAHLVKRFKEIMPHKDIVELPNIGHFPHFETPDETLRHFLQFHLGLFTSTE